MNKKLEKAMALGILSSMLFSNTALAAVSIVNKSETVYVIKENGQNKDKIVSVWLNSDQGVKGQDKTDLKDIKNLKSDQKIKEENGYIHWDENSKDVYYQGKTTRDLPVDLQLDFYLDGEKTTNQDLKGKSGHLKIVLSAENKNYVIKNIAGKKTKVYAPYVVMNTMSFDESVASNIKAENSKVVKDGKNEVISSVLTPGLTENFQDLLEDIQMEDFKNQVTIEMDVKDYQPIESYAVISNELFQNKANIKSINELRDGIQKLQDNAQKLVDGSMKLTDAQEKINHGIQDMDGGVQKLNKGSQELYDKSGELENKVGEVIDKVKPIPGYAKKMAKGGDQLSSGISAYTSGVGKMNANTGKMKDGARQLAQGSRDLDNGLGQLKGATSQLRLGSKKLEKMEGLKGDVAAKMGALREGIGQLSKGASNLEAGIGQAQAGANILANANGDLNNGIQKINSQVQAISLPAGPGAGLQGQLESIGGEAADIKRSTGQIDKAIDLLAGNPLLAGDPDAQKAVALLRSSKDNIQSSAGSIGKSAQAIGAGLGSSGAGNMAEQIQKLKGGMDQLATSSQKLNEEMKNYPNKFDALKDGAAGLKQGADRINQQLGQSMQDLDGKLDTSELMQLADALVKLDVATGQLKDGSSKLRQGTEQSEQGVDTLADAIAELDSNSAKLNEGANDLSKGLNEFSEKSIMFNEFPKLKSQGITPMRNGIHELNSGISSLGDGTIKLKNGEEILTLSMKTFSEKLAEFKQKGIDELDRKTKDLPETKEIIDTMSDLAKKDTSFTGSSQGFKTKYRIIEKIK